MVDFSPLAVLHHQGLGQVVREPSVIDLEGELVTTSLAYVEVISRRKSIPLDDTIFLWMDNNRIYVFHMEADSVGSSLF
jgi:hypothetical protein